MLHILSYPSTEGEWAITLTSTFQLFNDPKINTTKDVDILAKHGNLSWGFAADFFFTNELFPWEYVPDLVIGRALIDNWLIWYSNNKNRSIFKMATFGYFCQCFY
jgi:hypothetical protein